MNVSISKVGLLIFSMSSVVESISETLAYGVFDLLTVFRMLIGLLGVFGVVFSVASMFSHKALRWCSYIVVMQFILILVWLVVGVFAFNVGSIILYASAVYFIIYGLMYYGFRSEISFIARKHTIMSKPEIKWFDGEKLV